MPKQATLRPGVLNQIPIDDLSGGVDLRHSPTLMAPNRARALRNWSLREAGALTTWPGFASFSTASLGAGRCQGGQRVYLSGSTFTLAAFGGSVYKPNDSGVWGSAVLSSLHATNQMQFLNDRDIVAVFDSSNVPKKSVDGTTWTQMGITAPATAPTASAVAGGSLVDGHNYRFSYAYKDDGLVHYSNESATVDQAVAGASLTVRVHVTASADTQVDKICIYAQDVDAGESARRKCKTVANSTADVDITANDWTDNDEPETTHGVPPALAFGTVWKYRWWCVDAAVKNRLRFSEIYAPQAWPGDYYLDIPFERGDTIAGVIAQGDTLVVFGYVSKPYLVIGQTSLDFEVRPAVGSVNGAVGFRAVDAIEYGIVHAANAGVYLFDGATDRLLSYDLGAGTSSDDAWQDVMTRATDADIRQIDVKYHEQSKCVHIAVPRLYPTASPGEWIIDLNRTRLQESPAWTATTRNCAGYILWNGAETVTGNKGRLFSWDRDIGKLFEEVTGASADGSNQTCEVEGATIPLGKYVGRWIEVFGEFMPAAGAFTVDVYIDGKPQGTQTVSIGSTLTAFGSGVFGTATFGGKDRDVFHLMLPLSAEGRTAKVKGQYVGQAQFKWYSLQYNVVPETAMRTM